jgi:hypothetical protein
MDRYEISSLYRGPSIDASYQVSVHLAEGFQRRRLKCEKLTDDGRQVMAKAHVAFGKVRKKNRPIRNKNCLWWPCLLMDRDEMSNLYSGPSIDASYQDSLPLAEGFQRRRLKCEKLTDETPSHGKSSHCLWQGELQKKEKENSSFIEYINILLSNVFTTIRVSVVMVFNATFNNISVISCSQFYW